MSKSFKVDLTAQRFGRLTVLEFVPTDKYGSFWKCLCDCGNRIIVRGMCLKRGDTLSCGCLRKETTAKTHSVHGLRRTRLYNIWTLMKNRCYNPNACNYNRYGSRGIKICDEWINDFKAFYDWSISHGYSDNLSIDRIDNNGNYEPSNCRWVDNKTQCRNIRRNVLVEYNGKMITLPEAAEITGIDLGALRSRYRNGDRGERLFRPVRKTK